VELLRAIARDPALAQRVRLVVLLRRGVRLPDGAAAAVDVARTATPAHPAAARAALESRAVARFARERGCAAILQESLPLPKVGIPVVLTMHDLRELGAGAGGAIRRRLAPAVLRRGWLGSARIVAVSEFTRKGGIAAAPETAGRWAVVPNAADHLAVPSPAPPREEGLVLFVGHLEARKGADLLLEAFAVARRKLGSARLRFAGSGPLGRSLRARARELRLGDAVAFGAPRDDAELSQLYSSATVVAVPSRHEGFGIPLLEAMRLGAPVLAADAAALPEVAGGAARLVAGFEADRWGFEIARLLADPTDRARLALAGSLRAREYSWDRSARALADVLEAVAAGAR
jgi:glycosyltransferase involved in cell wall biosynthesis